ncbi:MAG: SDR family oxidoreductase [Planctomycetota bacterium]
MILVTGATGFVGGEVLKRLLDETQDSVIALVRASSLGDARRRGRAALLALYGRVKQRHLRRVEWLPADLELERLGLSEEDFARVAASIRDIYHCAASTRFDLPYDEARRINVVGLHRIHDLAVAAGPAFRRLNHVSTAYVVGERPGATTADFLPGPEGPFRNTYEQTKAEAERFLREQARVPFAVFRPSIVVGDSQTGRTGNWNVVYFPMRLMADGKLPCVPHIGPALIDCVPVDFVADAIVRLGRREGLDGQTINLTAGEAAISVRRVVEHTYAGLSRRAGREVPVATRPVGRLGWWLLSRWARLRHPGAARFFDRFAVYEPYCRVETQLGNARELELLAEVGVALPDMDRAFARVVDYALEENFGREREHQAPAARPASVRVQTALRSAVESFASGEISGFGAIPA